MSSPPITIHNFYVPSGGDVPDPSANVKFKQKLAFLDAMGNWSEQSKSELTGQAARTILVGDLNVAPFERDVWSHKQMLDVVSHTPAETKRLLDIVARGGWMDVMRARVPISEKLYTWWSYRAADWRASNRGRRLDHVWASPLLGGRVTSMKVLDGARGWEKPSDHVPVIVDFDLRE
jgi:exodeoxyribonuclease-3